MERRGELAIRGVVAAAALLLAAGCQSKPPAPMSGGGTSTALPDSEFREAPLSEQETPPASNWAETGQQLGLDPIYFDYDRFSIRDDAKRTLRGHARAIQSNPDWGVVTIEGHCDERGSEEYNLALGDQRADSARRYLIDLGVPSSRLSTVSYGEAKPAVRGHNESAWRYNRRSEMTVGALR